MEGTIIKIFGQANNAVVTVTEDWTVDDVMNSFELCGCEILYHGYKKTVTLGSYDSAKRAEEVYSEMMEVLVDAESNFYLPED